MKKTIFLFLLLAILFASCKNGDSPMDVCGAGFLVINNSSNSYTSQATFDEPSIIKEFDNSILGGISNISPNAESFQSLGVSYYNYKYNLETIEKRVAMFNLYDSNGNIVYRACGFPESWKENAPDGWDIPQIDYDCYEIGWLDKDINNSIQVYSKTSEGNKKIDNHSSFVLTINEDDSITVKVE